MKRIESIGARQLAHRTILYIEDEDENWEVAQLRLSTKYQLHRASTDEQACQQLRQHHTKLFAILMDIQLRGSSLNGMQLTRLFRGETVDVVLPDFARNIPPVQVPIFYVTAYATAYSEHTLLSSGANGVITKPVDFVKLMRALTEVHVRKIGHS